MTPWWVALLGGPCRTSISLRTNVRCVVEREARVRAMLMMPLLSKKPYRAASVVGFRDGMWPFARCGHPGTHRLQPGEREHSGPGGSSPGCQLDGEASTLRKRLQQANNVARKRDTD